MNASIPLILLMSQMTKRPGVTGRTRQIEAGSPTDASAGASADPPTGEKILCGFWFSWNPQLPLTGIPKEYNLICIAFLEPDDSGIPTFTPYMDENEFKAGIEWLKENGHTVLISLGGAHEGILLHESDKALFKQELMDVIEKYGFQGIDIDLEGASVTAGDNRNVVATVIREIKDEYRAQGIPFLVTMAPEFNMLRGADAPYKPLIEDLEGYYDLIFPQYYNQGSDGIWSDEYNMYLSQNSDEYKAEFLYTLTNAIVTGTGGYMKIPADKFAIGLPASPMAAINGYVEDPADVKWALDRLAAEGNEIRGLMTWSINQDAINDYEFMNRYAPMVYS